MVFAVQCPNPQCRKYMLVEENDRNKAITCLICKVEFRTGEQAPPTEKAKPAEKG